MVSSFFELQKATPRAARVPAAVRSRPLRDRLCPPPPKERERDPPGQASTHRRQRTHLSASTVRSFTEMHSWGQTVPHRPQPVQLSPKNRMERRDDLEKSPRNVPTGQRASQKGRPFRRDHRVRARKNAAVLQKSPGTKGTLPVPEMTPYSPRLSRKTGETVDPPGQGGAEKLGNTSSEGGVGVKKGRNGRHPGSARRQDESENPVPHRRSRSVSRKAPPAGPPPRLLEGSQGAENGAVGPPGDHGAQGKGCRSPPPPENGRNGLKSGKKGHVRPPRPEQKPGEKQRRHGEGKQKAPLPYPPLPGKGPVRGQSAPPPGIPDPWSLSPSPRHSGCRPRSWDRRRRSSPPPHPRPRCPWTGSGPSAR